MLKYTKKHFWVEVIKNSKLTKKIGQKNNKNKIPAGFSGASQMNQENVVGNELKLKVRKKEILTVLC